MHLLYQYMTIFLNLSPTSSHLHLLQVENCDSNSRLVVDEDDNGKFRLQKVNPLTNETYVIVHLQVCPAHTMHNWKCLKIISDRLVEF